MTRIIIADLIGVPFKNSGRDMSGLDCYGLVKIIYSRLGIELPDHIVSCFDVKTINGIYEAEKHRWLPTDQPVFPDIIAMCFNAPVVNHVGVYLGNGQFIHARQGSNVSVESTGHIYWKHAIRAYYHYERGDSHDSFTIR